ncbi:deoxyribodipyrimidine photo-lyase [Limibaculum sp. M0105]|uniref:Deoxyribodipyrimidine photo-lyase n=1 Tax=Thermohalobaculum xanthum TaxID=2753746 RepID=A0A8J7SEB7_9RHOB|nr:deoxyribodipyrimidine photo-lyase [Thermohalobaculum xanthum]MBK0398862.1 deoxyribodipyrimidine photo-lyase [Thermohalobaculum xanthum]
MPDRSSADLTSHPTLLWLRKDLRLGDHPAWARALASGGPAIPVYILDPVTERAMGAAPRWRLGLSLEDLGRRLVARGSRLVLRRGDALDVLRALVAETGARSVVWSRLYDPQARARDGEVKAALRADGIEAISVNASLLHEPWEVETGQGSFFKVYTPFWRAVRGREPSSPLAEPGTLAPPGKWPASETLSDWRLGGGMKRGAAVVARFAAVGENAALDRLGAFVEDRIAAYKDERDRPDILATSRLSENLAYGEISPRTIWHAGRSAMERLSGHAEAGAEHFLKELAWREFAYHLLYHTPRIETENWRPEWDDFPWHADNADAERWRRGMTGIEMVDAGMREMYATGTMHNRLRMLVASFLTKHLLTHWRVGEAWFRDCLIDWDPASNAMGWQWVAGSGPDAAPYFRVFNPETQAARFDPERRYVDRFIAEGRDRPHEDALSYFDAVPRSWGLSASDAYPQPVIGLREGRERALAAYQQRRSAT